MYEFLHRVGQIRSWGDVRCMTVLPPIVLQNSLLRCERAIIESK